MCHAACLANCPVPNQQQTRVLDVPEVLNVLGVWDVPLFTGSLATGRSSGKEGTNKGIVGTPLQAGHRRGWGGRNRAIPHPARVATAGQRKCRARDSKYAPCGRPRTLSPSRQTLGNGPVERKIYNKNHVDTKIDETRHL